MGAYNPPPELARMIADLAARVAVLERRNPLMIDAGGPGVGLRFGTASVVFSASPYSATLAVTHGLGKTPIAVVACGLNSDIGFGVTGPTNTQFSLQGHYNLNVNLTGTFAAYWVAIG